MADTEALRNTLLKHKQEHLLAFAEQLDADGREALAAQLGAIDWEALAELIDSHVLTEPQAHIPEKIEPPEILPAEAKDDQTAKRYERAHQAGEQLLSEGKVAAFVVAGGQGTRLGYDGPKGCYPATPIKAKSLFQGFAEQILAARQRYSCQVPWYVMTSLTNDDATRAFFAENRYFGLPAEDVKFFKQGTMPAIGADGKVLLADKDRLALSPNGHGGSLTALADSGSLTDMARRGVEYISYFQVDNPLTKVLDPLFIGLHAETGSEMSAKALPKREPLEKLGNFCVVDGRTTVIEYSDLPEELARQTESNGQLRFRAGSIAIHIISRTFVERLTGGGKCALPFHRAEKKVSHIDDEGRIVEPTKPNAIKLEMFVFDAMPLAAETMILETSRIEEFSPIKNATGSDSPTTSKHDQVRRAAEWLEKAGLTAPRDAEGQIVSAIEISPLFAIDPRELAQKVPSELVEIVPGKELYLGP